MILVKNILKKYGNKKVVNDVSVNIEKGKITSFIGPNGAGKSTLLSMITRLMNRDFGEVYIEGKEISTWDKKELSKKIAQDLNFVRVDWMIYKGKLYFEELTFTPYAGFRNFKSKKNELKLGELINL